MRAVSRTIRLGAPYLTAMTRVVDHPPAAVVFDFDFDTALRASGARYHVQAAVAGAGFELRRRKPTDLQFMPGVCGRVRQTTYALVETWTNPNSPCPARYLMRRR